MRLKVERELRPKNKKGDRISAKRTWQKREIKTKREDKRDYNLKSTIIFISSTYFPLCDIKFVKFITTTYAHESFAMMMSNSSITFPSRYVTNKRYRIT
jgi:hypothetical protein